MSNNVVLHFVQTTPPITRILVFLTIIVSLSVYLDLLAPQQISYSRFYLKDFEFHRIFTTFFYYGRMNFELVMNFIFLYRYSSMLEESYGKTSEYLYTILLIFFCLFFTSNVFYVPFLGTSLSNTITYLWTRKNPQSIVQIFGFVSFSAFYLPFIFPVVTLIFEGNVSKDEIVGIVVGHIIFYFTEVYPKFGKNFLKTPCALHRLFKEECDLCLKKAQPVSVLKKKIEDFRKNGSASLEIPEHIEPLISNTEKKNADSKVELNGDRLTSNENVEAGEEWEEADSLNSEECASGSLKSIDDNLAVEDSKPNKETIDQNLDKAQGSEIENGIDQNEDFESGETADDHIESDKELTGHGKDGVSDQSEDLGHGEIVDTDEDFESEELELLGRKDEKHYSSEDEHSWQSS
ncbi:uncharacterized protein VICG_01890 [Vittaforma corneae ATCC 50505]|uniref:Derlin n=1 Tax=Vittaforma corneae (strain ATCC 50505) TaxID=993615 RepID=L2GLE7_VITCO|nr:uncharacterized protein VICG_01890 [Vittaforma corneae ATCC 50505]ELA41097.1 hypothetical protein VICG_01890 [Vittaforma corneae ATCC 50505]